MEILIIVGVIVILAIAHNIDKKNENKRQETMKTVQENELDKKLNKTFSEDYLNTKLEDGLTIREHMQQDYINVLEYEKNSCNPKFHRTFEEEELSFQFSNKHSKHIDRLEDIIYNSSGKQKNSTLEEIKQSIEKCNDSIKAYYELKEFCYRFKGGKIYFQDVWEYCHNSKKESFEYVEQLYDTKEYLLDLYEEKKQIKNK